MVVMVVILLICVFLLFGVSSQENRKNEVRIDILHHGAMVASVPVRLKALSGNFEIPIDSIGHLSRVYIQSIGHNVNQTLFRVRATIYEKERAKEVVFVQEVHKLDTIVQTTGHGEVNVFRLCDSSCDAAWTVHIRPEIKQPEVVTQGDRG